eukprot:COSAG02_NODE_15929_length_1128_cov_3.821186_2_plen_86_part_01
MTDAVRTDTAVEAWVVPAAVEPNAASWCTTARTTGLSRKDPGCVRVRRSVAPRLPMGKVRTVMTIIVPPGSIVRATLLARTRRHIT